MAIRFYHPDGKLRLSGRTELQKFIPQIFRREGRQLKDISFVFCSDERLLGINREFLDHDEFTDILTFDLSEEPKGPVTGEIYISMDRVGENADKFGVSIDNELYRIIFHGVLHLCGYQDKTKKDQQVMRKKENEYLDHYFG